MRNLTITEKEAQLTLATFLQRKFPSGFVRKVFDKKGVRVNGERGRPETVLKKGDILTFYIPLLDAAERLKTPSKVDLDILFEDRDLLVINKKAGIAVHEGKDISFQQSLIGQLQTYYKDKGVTPYLVHRLDKDTSGCLVVAKNEETAKEFEHLFEKSSLQKEYLALVKGVVKDKKGKIDIPLPGREATLVSALTFFKVEKIFEEAELSLLRVQIETGRMHQIRIHLSKISHPVVMDNQYGDFAFNKNFRKAYGLKRQFLHAEKLTFQYKGKLRSFTAPLPGDLKKTLQEME